MNCPRCVQRIHRAAESCPHCGFSIADADAQFGIDPVQIRCLNDSAGILRRRDRENVEAAMEKITRRFPQIFVALYTGSLGNVASIRPFSFWLLNRAVYEDAPSSMANDAGILVTIDPESKAATMVFGYLLDPFLSTQDIFECLSRAHPYWLDGRYADGFLKALNHLEVILRKKFKKARRDSEPQNPKPLAPHPAEDLGQGVRALDQTIAEPPTTEEATS